ncbi:MULTISPECIES: GNAT family N-acetyltransferase [Shewanella]|uniref:GNAT family N-acetyltransferase n=1 Tax=Shewanella TaxID=22 RepID=UPI001782B1A5|nr:MULTISPECIES: GNAT family N-acetyltransferase [Shewanella]
MHEFETENLFIRLLEEKDRKHFIALYTNPKIMKNIAQTLTIQQANNMFDAILHKYLSNNYEMMIWVIYRKEDRQFSGIESLSFQSFKDKKAEAGLILDRLSHGKGTAVEALVGLIEYGFSHLNLNLIYARCGEKNYAPQRVLRRSGFTKLGSVIDGTFTYAIHKK